MGAGYFLYSMGRSYARAQIRTISRGLNAPTRTYRPTQAELQAQAAAQAEASRLARENAERTVAERWEQVRRRTVLGHREIASRLNMGYWDKRIRKQAQHFCIALTAGALTMLSLFVMMVLIDREVALATSDCPTWAVVLLVILTPLVPLIGFGCVVFPLESRCERNFYDKINAEFAAKGHDVERMMTELRASYARKDEREQREVDEDSRRQKEAERLARQRGHEGNHPPPLR